MDNEYELLDSGESRKLERFGDVVLSRPCEQAFWEVQKPELWATSAASFDRDRGWNARVGVDMPSSWVVRINGIALELRPGESGQIGVFPETRELWDWIADTLRMSRRTNVAVLNLFAYTGGATLAVARAGSSVCHLDASRPMVVRAQENAAMNGLGDAPIRWIVDDVNKFLDREIRRERSYDAIILDPPSFGRGPEGEQYRIDRDLVATLEKCRALLSETPVFVLLTSHTENMTAEQLESLLGGVMESGRMERGQMDLRGAGGVRPVPSGVWTRWRPPATAG